MILDQLFKYGKAYIYKSNNAKNNMGVNAPSYSFLFTLDISRIEPVMGDTFSLEERGQIRTGMYKVFSLTQIATGFFMWVDGRFYRIDKCDIWNYEYYEYTLFLMEGVCPQ